MKHKYINAQTLADNVQPPAETFAQDTMGRLRAMAAQEERPASRKLRRTVWIAALLIVLLAATALAIGLRRTAEADAVVSARLALTADYGLTTETIGCFTYQVTQEGSEWVVTFIGASLDPERLGVYTVRLPEGGTPQVTWSHDDIDPALWQDGSPDAPVWGQAQILKGLHEIEAQRAVPPDYAPDELSFAEAADQWPVLLLGTVRGETLRFYRVVPEEDDLAVEQALALAQAAVHETYGVDAQALSGRIQEVSFVMPREGEGEHRQYVILYRDVADAENYFATRIASPSGEMLGCQWVVAKGKRTLPEGPLDAYAHAVEEFMISGALKTKNAAVKADIVQRVHDADLSRLLYTTEAYLMPGEEDIPEAEAIAAAKAAITADFGVDQEAFALLDVVTSLYSLQDERTWEIVFTPAAWRQQAEDMVPIDVWHLDWVWGDINARIGTYSVWLRAGSGEIESATWSLAWPSNEETFTQSTWGEAPVYTGRMLLWVRALRDAVIDIHARYPADATAYDFTIEDAALYDTLFREAGFDAVQYYRVLPDEDAIPYEEALAIAKAAILAEMPGTEATLEAGQIIGEYWPDEPGGPAWRFSCFFTDNGVQIDFGMMIDAMTGEITQSGVVTGGVG